jgi:hypothetical protein
VFKLSGCAARLLGAALAVSAVGLSGCASITGSELQLISLQTFSQDGAPVAGADCKLSNDKGTWYAKSPASPAVARSSVDLNVNCEAAGQTPGAVRAVSRANAGMAGNIIFGGVIGVIIDHNRGTAYDYPDAIRVTFGANLVVDKNDDYARPAGAPSTPAPIPPAISNSAPGPQAANVPSSSGTQTVSTVVGSATGPNSPASTTLPMPGSTYRYVWADQQFSRRRQEFQVRVSGVDGWMVMESFSADGRPPVRNESWAETLAFSSRLLGESQTLVEFAPYLQSRRDVGSLRLAEPSGYSTDAMGGTWMISMQMRGSEPVTVPAGTFTALRVDVQGTRTISVTSTIATSGNASRFEFAAWYVPELKRYVRSRHRIWNPARMAIGDELVELLEYRPN